MPLWWCHAIKFVKILYRNIFADSLGMVLSLSCDVLCANHNFFLGRKPLLQFDRETMTTATVATENRVTTTTARITFRAITMWWGHRHGVDSMRPCRQCSYALPAIRHIVAMSSSGHRVVVMSSQPRRHMVATLPLFRPHIWALICHRAVVTTRFEIPRLSTNCMPHSVPLVFFKKRMS